MSCMPDGVATSPQSRQVGGIDEARREQLLPRQDLRIGHEAGEVLEIVGAVMAPSARFRSGTVSSRTKSSTDSPGVPLGIGSCTM